MVEVFFYGEQRTVGIYRTMAGAQKAVDALALEQATYPADQRAYADIVELELQD
jgi:hypothetical protein